ncbi:MAG: ADP-ribosylglycohydrolase family protein [Muribaculaceae bacterium]|nr:ADP-ribosylglycohydrolase family protein [Muribaculaceae bacterium]
MLGTLCGDIIGSAYEWYRVKYTNFNIFTSESRFTDDTVCSIAIADALLKNISFDRSLQYWCRKYPRAGYGGNFRRWIVSSDPKPYNSWGNGSAMRVSSIGAYAESIDELMQLAENSAAVTHNHPEGIKGAQATALAIYLALRGCSKEEIKQAIENRFGYDLSRLYWDIQRGYSFEVSCQKSVPEAIIAFLEGTDYESVVRLAVAYGGDADTQAAIAGGIAAAYYGEIPESILNECMSRLPQEMKRVINNFSILIENGRN